ncbi:MAG: HlyD family efflux transporter periplasmic adaptor subunit [Cyclobacteriaceae bacterium]|nr:HlyD family efflux transporter periplasmic adaptor subunit [Cyclobacteriaceae bacterium]
MKRSSVLVLVFLAGCNQKMETFKPAVKPLIEAVYASGYVVSEQEYQVFSQADGTLKQVVVKEGERVKQGQPLLIIESIQQSARYTIAKEAHEQAKANKAPALAELEASLQSAQSKMQFDSINFQRYENLLKSNATSRMEFDRAQVQYKNSRNEYRALKNRLIKTQNDIDLAIQNSFNQLQIAEEESGNYVVRSDIDGIVFKIMKERGELVRRSEVIAIVGQPDNFYLKLTVDELDVQRVKEGQEVVVKIDAYSNRSYRGTVSKIYPLVDTRQQSLRVDVVLNEKLPGIFSGLAVEANIIIRQKENALVIPKHYLLPGDSVLINTDLGTQKVKVIPGIETLEEVEIFEGLSPESNLVSTR